MRISIDAWDAPKVIEIFRSAGLHELADAVQMGLERDAKKDAHIRYKRVKAGLVD
jgi:hypothetical protein